MKKTAFGLLAAGLAATVWSAWAGPSPDGVAPLPYVKPNAPAVPAFLPASPDVTGSIIRPNMPLDVSDLKAGLDALSSRDAARAMSIRNALPITSLDRHILTWAIAISGQRDVPSSEITAAQRVLNGWPGIATLRANSERAMLRESPQPSDVIAYFATTAPETPEGTLALATAFNTSGHSDQAQTLIRRIWTSETMDTGLEDRVLSQFSGLLSVADHKARMDYLMYRNRVSQAKRFGDLGKVPQLYTAWAAVLQKSKTAAVALNAVPAAMRNDPAYLYARIENLRHQQKYEEAAALLAQAPKDPVKLGDPGEWWNERRIVARGLADLGDFKQAYNIVANHSATSAVDIADAEFHAGWYALRALQDPASAAKHFNALLQASNRPLSASRAYYWLGRTAEAGGPGNARDYFTKAAANPGTFYGQLAAARIGTTTINVTYPSPTDNDRQHFADREAVRAIERLEAAGYSWRADSLYRALAEQMDSPGELAILATRAEANNNHQVSLQIGKTAFSRGIDAAALAYPIGVIPGSANISGSGKALAYAIARQESAFNPAAVSPANARGLLQLLPGTAKGVASRHGMDFTQAKLTTDAGYNATLGAHYLGEQIDSFGGSYILTFVAYNAGPKRVPEWIARYGDPRGKPIDDVVDWIERIPFPETRNYVQRVMENYQIYKTRLGQKADIVTDLRDGRPG
ncbi:lytic transglycosylase domain-containing protein [Agrobacterium rubi]|uniref:Lytic transglycosylase domain-containing protein n=1 Tax=Agrobacterium rubi TaxID=28099 RepID=A0AAE7R8Z3_9HYPH|nr:lytic transglycosylase domain-containing protein [Agrobacterium rubi]NTE85884.1 lytic transglycosylase domain-containing protein [Agrobacterium rubi]NTF01815.1 lytic transglycosylase domain-containing protein [Agrobacterium rubi]NTF36059.1 lytic transglycosylase domain-containing protein [Agrobacterium rubi]OCJ54752.1 lytic transglycosylase [Agrobacterium rubi]QTG01147.1 lytic transglycosylase domain-containing protein [Agrobacterium rubi]